MGRASGQIVIYLTLSDHNSEQDRIDRDLAEELRSRIDSILQDEKFQNITPLGVELEL